MRTRKNSSKFAGDYQLCLASKLAIAYCRGSTEEQVNTLLVQENAHRSYAGSHGFELVDVIVDSGTSAEKVKFFDRPKIHDALALMQMRNAFHLFVTKTDRAFRNHEDCIVTCRVLWEDYGISVHFIEEGLVSSSEKDRMVLQIRASVAEEENRRRRDRQFGALTVMRANRERCGHYEPYGWRIDPERFRTTRRGTRSDYLVPDPGEQRNLGRIFALMQVLNSTSKVARVLNSEGIAPKCKPCYLKGGEKRESRGIWYPATVQSVLEHSRHEDGTYCWVENRGGRLVFEFRNDKVELGTQENRKAA